MKHLIKLLALPCFFFSIASQSLAKDIKFEAENTYGNIIKYRVLSPSEMTVIVIGRKDKLQDLVIPDCVEYNGQNYIVTEIEDFAFAKNIIKTISFPNTLRRIGLGAFNYCRQLEEVIFPEGLTEIDYYAFNEIYSLRRISFPNTIKTIGGHAFGVEKRKNFDRDYELLNLPLGINEYNCEQIGISKGSVIAYIAYHPREPQTAAQPQQQVSYVQAPAQQTAPEVPLPNAPSSDVDIDIPQGNGDNENTFAVIFANENYQEEVNVDYALNDGEVFKTYCQKVFGIPEDNIHFRKDATRNNMIAEISWMEKVAAAYNGEARFIVYYAGHGIPDEKTGTSYLLPVDGKGNMLETGYSLKQFYNQLGGMPSSGVTIFMDACFSGSKRGDGMLVSARGVAIKAKPQAPQGNMVVFSAAQGDETAYPYKEKGHGLFTYYLLKKLKETGGNVSLEELGQFITNQVSRKSIVANGKSQTPTVVPSETFMDNWKNMKLK